MGNFNPKKVYDIKNVSQHNGVNEYRCRKKNIIFFSDSKSCCSKHNFKYGTET